MSLNQPKKTHIYLGVFVLEALTPIFVGTGKGNIFTDALVQKDANAVPYIPASSIAGALGNILIKNNDFLAAELTPNSQNNDIKSSAFKISDAKLLINPKQVSEGIMEISTNLQSRFVHLPIRNHVKINHKGVKEDKALFDNEIVYKGVRFIFEIEWKTQEDNQENWEDLIQQLNNPFFRLGSGKRNGYGALKLVQSYSKSFNMQNEVDFNAYLNFPKSFNTILPSLKEVKQNPTNSKDYTHYQLNIKPEDFFIFGAGIGDEESDQKNVQEDIVIYNQQSNEIEFKEQYLIPASSIKGAIAHRFAFYCNKANNVFADDIDFNNYKTPQYVKELFGDVNPDNEEDAKAGKLFINDIYLEKNDVVEKRFNHVAIDRFTGGAMDGALFAEKTLYYKKESFPSIEIWIKDTNEVTLTYLEETLKDICKGTLPLGGMTTKGHGFFTGKLIKNNELIFEYND